MRRRLRLIWVALAVLLGIGLLWALLTDNPCAGAAASCATDTNVTINGGAVEKW